MKTRINILACLLLFVAVGSRVQAQSTAQADTVDYLCRHCQQVAVNRYYNRYDITMLPPFKVAWWCKFSRESFFVTDQVPADAYVYNINEVHEKATGRALTSQFRVVLDSMNLYAYNFGDFQQQHWDTTLYFRTPGSEHAYLGLRGYSAALNRMDEPMLLRRYAQLPDNYFELKQDE